MSASDASARPVSNDALVASLPGFSRQEVETNNTRLHAVVGGSGPPLVLLPAWPMTWWEYRKVLPVLARDFRVAAIDLRGMGGSARPDGGYDKKTMARDLAGVMTALDIDTAHVVGSDIGSMVAYSFAANYPARVRTLAMLDTPHPFGVFGALPLLPAPGTYDLANPARALHPWWFLFSQIPDLPESLFAGRFGFMQNWVLDYLSHDQAAVSDHDRAVFAGAYEDDASIRASLGWFRAFDQDMADFATYAPLNMPVLGLGGIGHDFLSMFLQSAAPAARVVKLEDTGHWIASEKPDALVAHIREHTKGA
jgi:pimeloyl-ACP methyl ester carboxylesterase